MGLVLLEAIAKPDVTNAIAESTNANSESTNANSESTNANSESTNANSESTNANSESTNANSESTNARTRFLVSPLYKATVYTQVIESLSVLELPHPNPPLVKGRELDFRFPPFLRGD